MKEILDLSKRENIRVELVTQWAFYFEGKRCFEGTRALFDPMGIRKPLFNGFEMLSRLGETRLAVDTDDTEDDIGLGQAAGNGNARRIDGGAMEAGMSEWDLIEPHRQVDGLAAMSGQTVQVLVWNQVHDPNAGGSREIDLEVTGLREWGRGSWT